MPELTKNISFSKVVEVVVLAVLVWVGVSVHEMQLEMVAVKTKLAVIIDQGERTPSREEVINLIQAHAPYLKAEEGIDDRLRTLELRLAKIESD